MLSRLIPDIQNIVCAFAFDATLQETLDSLEYLTFLDQLDLHPSVYTEFLTDHSVSSPYVYDRDNRECVMRPWPPRYNYFTRSSRHLSPRESFFVWFARNEMFSYPVMWNVLSDIDWRTVRGRFKNNTTRGRFMEDIEAAPLAGAIEYSCLVRDITMCNLKLHPSGYTRAMVVP